MTRTETPARAAALPLRTGAAWPLMGGMMLATALCAALASTAAAQDGDRNQTVTFTAADGAEIGTAELTGVPAGLLIELDLNDLSEGWHGFHIHETGACDAEDGFKSAGGHFSVSDSDHGFYMSGGPHSGDMPNQYVAEDGTLKAQVFNPYAFLGGELDNVSGRALILHGGADDYESQPSGDAGDRVACAVIE